MSNSYSEITPYIRRLAELSSQGNNIKPEMYGTHSVKRGLRDENGSGVVTGLTEISTIYSKETLPDGTVRPTPGRLYYRGYDIRELVDGFMSDGRFGFEEIIYLLLFSELPTKDQLAEFSELLTSYRTLPTSFVRDIIMKAPGKDMMNVLSRSVLTLYSYDENADSIALDNVLRQCLQLISVFPLLAIYGYQSFKHYYLGKNLHIRNPVDSFSTAENMLSILRSNGKFSPLEAKILDLALVLHAEHGGGNNSTFTTHVVTSSGTDTYSAIAAALGSLKGPRHGGANIKVVRMFDDLKANVNVKDEGAIKDYLVRLLDKDAFDRAGLIYGMGHAVYSVSDPRADILRKYAEALSEEKGLYADMELYETVERLAPEVIAEKRRIYKGVSANIDFYSGAIYKMLDLPEEIFTPVFAVSRIAGWSAHRIEEIQNNGKIIRPAYIGVKEERPYLSINNR